MVPSQHSESERQNEAADHPINLQIYSQKSSGRDQMHQKPDSFRKAFQQIQKLTEDNKRIAKLEEINKRNNKELMERDNQLNKAKQLIGQKQ